MKKLFILIFLFGVLFAGKVYGQDKFVGKWELKSVVSDPDSLANKKGSSPLFIEKVTDGYYRTTMNKTNTLLYKIVDENTLYSNFSPKRLVSITWLGENEIEINARVINEDTLRPTVMLWSRVE